jgi:hypothetical protein
MGFSDEYLKLRKKRLEGEEQNATKEELESPRLLEPRLPLIRDDDIAPVKQTTNKSSTTKKESTERKWFQKGAFEDGYQFGDIVKSITSTGQDLEENVMAGILGIGESVVDAGAYLVGGVGGLFSDKFKDKTQEFIAKDLYDEKEVAKKIVGARNIASLWTDTDKDSLIGEVTEGLAQSGGQLLGTMALQSVGVPWFVTSGVTSFGSEVENASNQGATYGEAGWSAAVTAGAEILTEKIFGGSGLGEKGLINLDALTRGLSGKALKVAADYGLDVVGEGLEEVGSQFLSNLGTSLYREENLKDILFSEEALDQYLESFIGGAALGGLANVGKVGKSVSTLTDYRTGLNGNEQKVFDKVYEDRVAEAEQGGKKLTTKEKNKIYDEVMKDLERGYIDTDTIEEVLGGEDYQSYRDTIDSEDALQKEFDELGNLKKSDFTAKQDDRYNELKQMLAEMKAGNTRNQLKTELSEKVFGLTKGSKLSESYNEKARRNQAFEIDLSKYEGKTKEILKNIMDKRLVDNTRSAHEFWEYAAKSVAERGGNLVPTTTEEILDMARKKYGDEYVEKNFKGKRPNAFVLDDGTIAINVKSPNSRMFLLGHEITHTVEKAGNYEKLANLLLAYDKSKTTEANQKSGQKATEDLYEGIKGAEADKEYIADLVGKYIYEDVDFVHHLSTADRNLFQKIWDEIKYLYNMATAGSREKRDLLRIKQEFEKAYRESGAKSSETAATGETKYSLSEDAQKSDADYLDAVNRGDTNTAQKMVDEAARGAGYNYRGDHRAKTDFTVFDRNRIGTGAGLQFGDGFYISLDIKDKATADYADSAYGKVKMDLYVKMQSPLELGNPISDETVAKMAKDLMWFGDDSSVKYGVMPETVQKQLTLGDNYEQMEAIRWLAQENGMKISELLKEYGFDGVISENEYVTQAVVWDENQLKSADAITYDDNGNVIPLSQRFNAENNDIRYSLSDSDGKQLTKEQSEYFKDSKMRDDNGNLKVMYHGSQDAGFHVFDPAHSDDETSLFFVDRNDVAASYSGTTETYEAQTIHTAEDMNNFIEKIGAEGYEVVEENGKFTLLYEGDRVADSNTAKGIYEEFCWYEGVGEGDANYKVYLNLTNPLEVDAEGRNWNNVSREFSQELADRYNSLTEEEKDALVNLASWEDIGIFRDELRQALADTETGTPGSYDVDFARNVRSAYEKLGGNKVNMYDLFTIASDGFSAESINQFAVKQMNTRDYAQRAKEQGYDGVIFKNIVDVGGYSNGSEGASTVAIAFDSNQVKSVANDKPTMNADIRYSLSEDSDNVVSLGEDAVTKYSLSTWTPETQEKVRDNLIKAGYESDRVDKWIRDTNGVASVIAADRDRLDFKAADNQVMLKDNQEYIKTLDASTLCAKRLVYQGTFDAIQHRMPNTMLSSDDLIDLLNMMKEHGVQTPCGVCYVESRRRHLGKFAQDWLNSYNGEYKPNLDEVTTSDGLEALRKSHPQTYQDFVDAMNKKGSSNPKVVQLRTEYRNEIMSLTPAQVRKIEAIGGLRVQSFSDFETPHMLDMMQAVMDMSAKGLHSQAYTKVPNFAWVFGDTGIKINLSLIAEGNGFDADGNLAFSSTEGMDIDEAMRLRDAYSHNVGTIIVGANDKHILACMADDRIDFIIPFHRSGWGMRELDMMGMSSYTDYSYGQNEHDLNKPTKVVNGVQQYAGLENLYPIDYWDYSLTGKENAERYLNLCAKTGREPKFSKFLVNNGDGSYSLQPDGSTDGYWKTLIDFKMYDNDGIGAAQQTVQPNFNMAEAYRVLNEYEGGANTLPVANDVVEEFVAKYQSYEELAPAMSLSWENEAPVRLRGDVPMSDMRLETENVAPVQEDVAKIAKTTPTVSKMEQVEDYAPISEEEANALQSERVESLDDADAPPEMEAPYYGESEDAAPADPFEHRDIKEVGNRKVKAYMYENPEVKPFFQKEANIMLGELGRTTKGERFYTAVEGGVPGEYGAESYGVWTGTSRHTSPDIEYLLDSLGYSYAEIEKGLNAIIEDDGAENNACSKRIEFLLNDRLLNGYQDEQGYPIPADQDYINLLNEKQITEYSDEARKQFFEVADEYDPLADDDIAPVAEAYEAIKPKKETSNEPRMKRVKEGEPSATYETAKKEQVKGQRTMFAEGKTAEILTEEPKTDKKKSGLWSMLKNNVIDKGMVFEDLALETGNRELQARWNSIRYAEGKAQKLIGEGNASVSSLKSIQETVENSGKTKQFYEYLYHKHNVDRMSLEAKAGLTIGGLRSKFGHLKDAQIKAIATKEITDKTTEKTAQTILEAREYLRAIETKNKPVFGDSVTAEVSQETADRLEKANPEFKEYAQEVYDYMNYLREMLVDSGVISSDTAKLWSEMYPHYVPIRRDGQTGLNINVPLDTGKTGVNAPIKRATGGNSDILPLFDTMALRTEQTYKAIAKNRFGVELKNTLGTTIADEATSLDDAIDSVETQDGLLQEGKNGKNPTFTVFENGKKVTFEITEEMYDAIKPTSKGLSYTNKVANTIGNVFRGLLTEYNPVFMTTNAIKDAQDILINSQHAKKTYAKIPEAIRQMSTGGHWYKEYLENGGDQNTYFDNHTNTFKAEDDGIKKLIGMPLRGISFLNNTIEKVPRLAEYIASRESGASIDVAMLDAARVTTNFAAGGDVTKFFNRNGFNFLNASMQGAVQQVRNVREAKANGLKGWTQLATKFAIAGIPALILNNLLWDDDEEYEELSDYVKQNYYVVAKFGDGKFVRIPKGRTLAVIQNALEQTMNALTGDDEVDLQSFFELAISNLAPNNPLENNILAPIMQVANNETWHGEDLVPTRLQDLPEAEQFDESTDALSKWLGEKLEYSWLGEKLDFSPYKINYLLNQYSGGLGDVVLPMLTPEAESGDNSLVGNIIAPLKDKFTTDSVMNNQNVSDFYDTLDELAKNANSSYATDEDVLKYKYMNSVRSELSALYKEKREIQNSDLPNDEKYLQAREIQEQINALARDSLNTVMGPSVDDGYATVGDLHFRTNSDGEWQKITEKQYDKQEDVTEELGIDPSEYWDDKSEYDFAYEYPEKYEFLNNNGVTYDDYKNGSEEFKEAYSWAFKNPEKFTVSKAVASDVVEYRRYASELYDIKADKDSEGKSITGSRKEKVIAYVNNLDIDYGARLILFKNEYKADDTYNMDIINYLNGRTDISYEEMETILKELGFEVDSEGNITWEE